MSSQEAFDTIALFRSTTPSSTHYYYNMQHIAIGILAQNDCRTILIVHHIIRLHYLQLVQCQNHSVQVFPEGQENKDLKI